MILMNMIFIFNLQCPDWQCVYSLVEDIWTFVDDKHYIHDKYKGRRFDLGREGFVKIVKMIPYMMNERTYAYSFCHFSKLLFSIFEFSNTY